MTSLWLVEMPKGDFVDMCTKNVDGGPSSGSSARRPIIDAESMCGFICPDSSHLFSCQDMIFVNILTYD